MNINHRRRRTETAEIHDIRDLLEANLGALHALLDEQRKMIADTVRAVDGMRGELRAELRALGDGHAPWVKALDETRALLYVALKELIVGQADLDTNPGVISA